MPRTSDLVAPVGDSEDADAVRLDADGSLTLESGEAIVARGLAAPSIPGAHPLSEFSALIVTDRRVVWIDPSGGVPGPSMLERIAGGALRRPGTPKRVEPTALAGQVRFVHLERIGLRPRASTVDLDIATDAGIVTARFEIKPGSALRSLAAGLVASALRARGDADADRVDVRGRDDREWTL